MKKTCVLMALAALSAAAEELTFVGSTDRNPLAYDLNETMTFTVTLVDAAKGKTPVRGRDLRWTLTDDAGFKTNGTAKSDGPLVLTHALAKPGFARLKVEVATNGVWLTRTREFFEGGAGAALNRIPEHPAPADFAVFWKTAVARLHAVPFDGAYRPVCTNFLPTGRSGDGVLYFLFELPMPEDDRPATGVIALPSDASDRSCGLAARTFGYGFGATEIPKAADVLADGGTICLAIARHGERPVAENSYYEALRKGPMKGFCFWHNGGDVKATDFYKMLMRDLRALQFAKTFPQWNGKTAKTSGGSMGGYQALGLAALDGDVTSCSAWIPWCADLSGVAKFGRQNGWRPTWTATLDYVDLKNLATLCTCDVTISAGLGDYVCPPSGEVLLYRNLRGPKRMTFIQNYGHGSAHGPDCRECEFK